MEFEDNDDKPKSDRKSDFGNRPHGRFGDRRRTGGFNRGFRFNSEPREMHKATCSECGKECEVPFKPSKDAEGNPRPVYCKDCYAKRKPRF